VFIYVNKTLNGRLRELNNKGKVHVGNLKSGHDRLWELSLTRAFHYEVKVTVQTGFYIGGRFWSLTRVVARRASTHMILGILKSLFMLELELIRSAEI